MSDELSTLTNLLVSYTAQLEEYERGNGTFTLSSITILVAFLTLIASMNNDVTFILGCLAVPAIELVFIFVFVHYTRRIAFYRGYCVFLEKRLAKLLNRKEFFFHVEVKKKTMQVFGMGPAVMIGALIILFIISFSFCLYLVIKNFTGVAFTVGIIVELGYFVCAGLSGYQFLKALKDNDKVAEDLMNKSIN